MTNAWIATKLKQRGGYKVQIDNPVKFLEKLIGNNVPFQFQEELSKYFINEFQSKIKSSITRAANETTQELLGIEARLDEFADAISPFMQETLSDYGLKLVNFQLLQSILTMTNLGGDTMKSEWMQLPK